MPDDKIKLNNIENIPLPDTRGNVLGVEKIGNIVEQAPVDGEPRVVAEKVIPVTPAPTRQVVVSPSDSYDKRQKEIENILSRDLKDAYLALAEDKRLQFKAAGEETARKINELLDDAKSQAMKIVDLIKKWLSMLPGVNQYFIEQEAKIRADEIIRANEKN